MNNMTTKIIELIYTEERRGLGTKEDVMRLCPQLWTKEGTLVAEYDTVTKEQLFNPDYSDLTNNR
jgi:hypothetical protein